jgi:hypothetical protein
MKYFLYFFPSSCKLHIFNSPKLFCFYIKIVNEQQKPKILFPTVYCCNLFKSKIRFRLIPSFHRDIFSFLKIVEMGNKQLFLKLQIVAANPSLS